MFFEWGYQRVADIVTYLAADILAPALRHFDAQSWIVYPLQKGIDVSGIEIVACANGADGLYRPNRVDVATVWGVEAYLSSAVGKYQRAA